MISPPSKMSSLSGKLKTTILDNKKTYSLKTTS